jgi:hypothetical protein
MLSSLHLHEKARGPAKKNSELNFEKRILLARYITGDLNM